MSERVETFPHQKNKTKKNYPETLIALEKTLCECLLVVQSSIRANGAV